MLMRYIRKLFQRSDQWARRRSQLVCILAVHGPQYGVALRELYQELSGESVALGTLYRWMDRLESAGFVDSYYGETTPDRGGNRRLYFKISHRIVELSKRLEGSDRA